MADPASADIFREACPLMSSKRGGNSVCKRLLGLIRAQNPSFGFQERVVPPPLLFQPNHSLLLDPSTIVVLEALRNGDCLIERIASTSASRSEMNPASRMRRGNRPLRW